MSLFNSLMIGFWNLVWLITSSWTSGPISDTVHRTPSYRRSHILADAAELDMFLSFPEIASSPCLTLDLRTWISKNEILEIWAKFPSAASLVGSSWLTRSHPRLLREVSMCLVVSRVNIRDQHVAYIAWVVWRYVMYTETSWTLLISYTATNERICPCKRRAASWKVQPTVYI